MSGNESSDRYRGGPLSPRAFTVASIIIAVVSFVVGYIGGSFL